MPELLAAALLAACCLSPAACHPADAADVRLAASELQGQEQRPLHYAPSNPQEADNG